MTKAAPSASEDHIAELTRGLQLPLDPIVDAHLGVILEVISRAWLGLVSEGSQILWSGRERDVNTLLESRLMHACNTDPLFGNLVSAVARGKEWLNFDATKLENRPDFSIFLTDPKRPFPLIVECKIIDNLKGKGIDLYCNKGVARFIAGEYAWTNREGILVAYVRDGSSVAASLTPYLSHSAQNTPDPMQTADLPMPRVDLHPTAHFSRHERSFSYLPIVGGRSPGAITLAHLWLGGGGTQSSYSPPGEALRPDA